MSRDHTVLRPMEIMFGYRDMSRMLRVGECRMREFKELGAPVYLEGHVPRADKSELWEWYKDYCARRETASARAETLGQSPKLAPYAWREEA